MPGWGRQLAAIRLVAGVPGHMTYVQSTGEGTALRAAGMKHVLPPQCSTPARVQAAHTTQVPSTRARCSPGKPQLVQQPHQRLAAGILRQAGVHAWGQPSRSNTSKCRTQTFFHSCQQGWQACPACGVPAHGQRGPRSAGTGRRRGVASVRHQGFAWLAHRGSGVGSGAGQCGHGPSRPRPTCKAPRDWMS